MAVDIIARGMAATSVHPGSDGKIPAEYLPSYVDDVIDLIAVDSAAPAQCSEGDKYYNTTDKLIYTATGTNTWGSTGETPEDGKIYLNISANPATSYRWSGTDLVEIGQDLSNYMTLDSAQTVTGVKTFSNLPESSVAPTTDNQLVNKKYVDDNAGGGGGYSNIFSSDVNSLNNDSATKTKLAEFITNNKGGNVFIFITDTPPGNYNYVANGAAIFKMFINGIGTNHTYRGIKLTGTPYGSDSFNSGARLDIDKIEVTGTWSNNVFTISSVNVSIMSELYSSGNMDCYLSTTNSRPNAQVFTPTLNGHPATKKYVDDNVSQISTLPTAASTNEGRIYQYIGATDSTYTNGYFYQCVSDGGSPATYSWSQVNVQPGGGIAKPMYLGLNTDYSENNPLNLDLLELGTYMLIFYKNDVNHNAYIWLSKTVNGNIIKGRVELADTVPGFDTGVQAYLNYQTIPDGTERNFGSIDYIFQTKNTHMLLKCVTDGNNPRIYSNSYSSSTYLTTHGIQDIMAKKTFHILPESSVVPTTDNQLVNKKYVDDTVSNAIGSINTILATLTTPSNNGGN